MQNDFDVAVIGGGPAGVAAAAAAASGGGSVVLIEQSNRLGGSVTAAMHRSMCGLYSREPSGPMDTLNGSIQRDIVRRMMEKEPQAVVPRRFGKTWVLEFGQRAWESTLTEICAEAKVEQRLGRAVAAARRDGARLSEIQLRDSADWITAQVFIDCTGGGLLRLGGDDLFQTPDESVEKTLAGFAVRLADLTGDGEMLRLQTAYVLAKAVQSGELPANARFTVFYPGPAAGEGICKLAIDASQASGDDVERLAKGIVEHLRRALPEYSGARIVEMSPRVLPRAGLRLRGRYTVTEEDILQARKHGAGAVHGWWPIEQWDVVQGPTYAYPPVGDHYDIPTDALRSAVLENLLAAGACLSATFRAAASTRASGICLATGDAAGRLGASFLSRSI